MLLQSLRALRKAPGEAGRIWKNLEALVSATGVTARFAYSFQTKLHFVDVQGPLSFAHLFIIPYTLRPIRPAPTCT